MIPVNLLPAPRVARRAHAARIRAWSLGLSVYAALIAVAAIIAHLPSHGPSPRLQAELARLDQAAARSETDRTRLLTVINTQTRRLDAARAVGEHPDWSVLLTSIASARESRAVLEQIELKRDTVSATPKPDPAVKPAKPARAMLRTTYTLIVTGHAATPGAVFEYARALEGLRVFDEVVVKDTRNASLGQLPTTRFELRAVVAEPARPQEDAP
ncbi:MAG: hypothetical protein K2Q20_01935 [Phycisphaerales bacterium]|nr:hypothetical protein [Phycisphaerales bacterium]